MTNLSLILKRWGPVLLLMALIFAASAQPKPILPDFAENDFLVKKSGHLILYATLAGAYLRGLIHDRHMLTWRTAVLAVILAGLYGATDEYHQSFVAGRGATLLDVGIDTLGATMGVVLAAAWRWRHITQTPAPPAPRPSTR